MQENINWKSLGYPQVPELLRNLASDDADTQVDASNRLEAEVVLGGKDWQSFDLGVGISVALRNDAPLYLAQSLVGILKDVSGKSEILYLLARMLFYDELRDEGEIYKVRAKRIKTVIWEGREIYADLLSSKELKIRKHALYLLLEFKESNRFDEAIDLIVCRFAPILSVETDMHN